MGYTARTPEALLPRSDSKNPATTCRGITSTGRPCRRALAASPRSSPAPSPSRGSGVLAILDEQHAAAFYCWQHKDQAEQLAAKNRQKTSLHPLKERSSLDTLAERVGILDLDENLPDPRKKHQRRHKTDSHGPKRRDTLPSGWNEMQSPLMSVPDDMVQHQHQHQHQPSRPSPKRESNLRFAWSCCLQGDSDDDDDEPPPRISQGRPATTTNQVLSYDSRPPIIPAYTQPSRKTAYTTNQQTSLTQPSTPNGKHYRPSLDSSPSNPHTQTLLSLIPPNLSPQTTSLLLAELSRPISSADDAGYIYIFWLTPESNDSTPDDETASSLLDEDEEYKGSKRNGLYPSPLSGRARKTNETLQRYASVRQTSGFTRSPGRSPRAKEQRTILLKIGRAANVHRRMSQWTKQCGQNISLVRYYPHTPSNPQAHALSTSNSVIAGRKVPHVHRVERLIHLELAEKRVVKPECEACGREHREWFEIEASRNGLKDVDGVVKRWVEWAERAGMTP